MTFRPLDFESSASTSSTTRARRASIALLKGSAKKIINGALRLAPCMGLKVAYGVRHGSYGHAEGSVIDRDPRRKPTINVSPSSARTELNRCPS